MNEKEKRRGGLIMREQNEKQKSEMYRAYIERNENDPIYELDSARASLNRWQMELEQLEQNGGDSISIMRAENKVASYKDYVASIRAKMQKDG